MIQQGLVSHHHLLICSTEIAVWEVVAAGAASLGLTKPSRLLPEPLVRSWHRAERPLADTFASLCRKSPSIASGSQRPVIPRAGPHQGWSCCLGDAKFVSAQRGLPEPLATFISIA